MFDEVKAACQSASFPLWILLNIRQRISRTAHEESRHQIHLGWPFDIKTLYSTDKEKTGSTLGLWMLWWQDRAPRLVSIFLTYALVRTTAMWEIVSCAAPTVRWLHAHTSPTAQAALVTASCWRTEGSLPSFIKSVNYSRVLQRRQRGGARSCSTAHRRKTEGGG